MTNSNNKTLRLLIESIVQEYQKKYTTEKPPTVYIQFKIYELTGEVIKFEKIKNVKPFKKITKKSIIDKVNNNGQVTIKQIIRRRN